MRKSTILKYLNTLIPMAEYISSTHNGSLPRLFNDHLFSSQKYHTSFIVNKSLHSGKAKITVNIALPG